MVVSLTDEERIKFAEWLEADAEEQEQSAVEFESLGVNQKVVDAFYITSKVEVNLARKLRKNGT